MGWRRGEGGQRPASPAVGRLVLLFVDVLMLGMIDCSRNEKWNSTSCYGSPRMYSPEVYCVSQRHVMPHKALLSVLLSQGALRDLTLVSTQSSPLPLHKYFQSVMLLCPALNPLHLTGLMNPYPPG